MQLSEIKTVSVIGAAGHVGFPFSCVLANAGYTVYGIDINMRAVALLNSGCIPYIEEGAKEILSKTKVDKKLEFTTDFSFIKKSDAVAIMIGTPVDGEGNARLDALFDFVDNTLISNMKRGQLIILRSTVSPGTTEVLQRHIQTRHDWIEGKDYYLVFCPERVVQGKSISETTKLPQMIGAFNENSFKIAKKFFEKFIQNEIFCLTPREAELGKLMTNMWRLMNGAFSNEMYMIGDKHGVNIDKIIETCNYDYPRLSMLKPGFMAGPCLYKDGKFLVAGIPYNEIVKNSFEINEGFPGFIFEKIKKIVPNIETLGILGMSFKANCDDQRNSLSHKMKKIAITNGLKVFTHDPYDNINSSAISRIMTCDAVIIMTPHDEYKKISITDLKEDQTKLFVDVWKICDFSKGTVDGFTYIKN